MGVDVLIVIVNYRIPKMVIDCLISLEGEIPRLPSIHVTVVDNASGDDSVLRIKKAIRDHSWEHWVSVLPSAKNGGFAFGNNEAVRQALGQEKKPKCIHLLNPDTLIRPNAVAKLYQFLKENPRVGIAGSVLEDQEGHLQCTAFRFPNMLSELDAGVKFGPLSRLLKKYLVHQPYRELPCKCDWTGGASMMIRREVFDTIGLMDEGYFLYFEEVDFCYRAKKAGWEVWCVPASRVVHLEGESTGIRKVKRRPGYWFASRRRFFVKNYGGAYATCTDCARVLGEVIYSLRRFVGRKTNNVPLYFVLDLIKHSIFSTGKNARVSAKNN